MLGAKSFQTEFSMIAPATPISVKILRPVVFLTINNGAAHTRAAEAISSALKKHDPEIPTEILEVSEFMSPLARFTHVSAYLWLVKNAPFVWEKIDSYQKRQTQTSPEWFYRRQCRKLFEYVKKLKPAAIVSTEVGCGEIAALIKRDLREEIPLAAVNLDCETDCAWVQPEVDLYCLANETLRESFVRFGAESEKIKVWGTPLNDSFERLSAQRRRTERERICRRLELDPDKPLILVSGGGEGLGKIELIAESLLKMPAVQYVVLTGHNLKLKKRLEKLTFSGSLRVLGWTDDVAALMQAADLSISKLGLTFYEAMTCGLPIIALDPPPGAERVQYKMLEEFGVGCAVKTVDEVREAVERLLADNRILNEMRARTEKFGSAQAAKNMSEWLAKKYYERIL